MWIELTVLYEKDGQPDYEALGLNVDSETEECLTMFNTDYIEAFNPANDINHSIIRLPAGNFRVQKPYNELKKLIAHA